MASTQLSGLKDPKIWMTNGWGAINHTGVAVSEELALSLTAVYRATSLLSGHMATAPLHLYRTEGKDRKSASNHPVARFIDNPGPDENAIQFRQTSLMQVLLWGNSYWRIYRDTYERPVRLENWHPSAVQVKRVDGQRRYRYKGVWYDWSDVLHFMGPSIDGITGMGPIQRMATAIGIPMATEQFQARFYSNGAHVGSVIVLPEGHRLGDTEDEAAIEGLLNSFKKRYTGMVTAHTPMVLEPGMKFEKLDMPFTSIQLLESKKFSVADVSRMFGVPLHKLSELDRSTNNNIEHQAIEYVQDSLLIWCTAFEKEYRRKLLYESEQETYYFKHNLNFLLRGDSKSRGEYFSKATGGAGWMAPDEVRSLEELNAVGADKLYRPLNMTTSIDDPAEGAAA